MFLYVKSTSKETVGIAEQNQIIEAEQNSLSLIIISSNGVLCVPSSRPLGDKADSGLRYPSSIPNSMRRIDKACCSLQRESINPHHYLSLTLADADLPS